MGRRSHILHLFVYSNRQIHLSLSRNQRITLQHNSTRFPREPSESEASRSSKYEASRSFRKSSILPRRDEPVFQCSSPMVVLIVVALSGKLLSCHGGALWADARSYVSDFSERPDMVAGNLSARELFAYISRRCAPRMRVD